MKHRALLLLGLAAMAAVPAIMWAQGEQYPITVIAPGKGPYTFPPGYQTPWDKIEIMVTEKMSPNLFVLHGSQGLDPAHPDASGGRAMALFGPDGVLMVDTQNRQVAEKTLKAIRSFTDAPIMVLVNTHVHGDHTAALTHARLGIGFLDRCLEMADSFGVPGRVVLIRDVCPWELGALMIRS